MFQLDNIKLHKLRSQIVTSKQIRSFKRTNYFKVVESDLFKILKLKQAVSVFKKNISPTLSPFQKNPYLCLCIAALYARRRASTY